MDLASTKLTLAGTQDAYSKSGFEFSSERTDFHSPEDSSSTEKASATGEGLNQVLDNIFAEEDFLL